MDWVSVPLQTDLQWSLQFARLPELGAALVLSMAVGFERQFRGKQAGVRTHALVGLGSALFMLVSKYGFADLLGTTGIGLDPSRIAAQIVSGIGFLGAGIIVFRSDAVRGLTTAASVWLTAAIGMACGGSLFALAGVVTAAYFLVVFVGPLLSRLTHPVGSAELQIEYRDGQGLLRDIVEVITSRQWRISRLRTGTHRTDPGYVAVFIAAEGGTDSGDLLDAVASVEGVRSVDWADDEDSSS
ncbi:MgtC/SapB family protein [Microlunatus sp. Gsoil 973]|jgi:putative Mg2+ transporter-C (MgtC) family protein|uniref:MgtC/SapB family protein n=1 Tax=Microlunatus sp. Gsoil 973 TaxID=2672569 RepID=UPI0012B488AC|nr:MgtC/SapB family protein [Microlunatus sp. Gsoil 973]QGN35031.1 MgtC/SapB family protein [Microlunatus sp. Gsoil 973]